MIEIKGKFQSIVYYNEETYYTVARFHLYDVEETKIVVTGYFTDIQKDLLYRLKGDYVEHPKYGMQFQVIIIEKVLPTDYDSQIAFLSSPLFPGIGRKQAESIIKKIGDDPFNKIRENPDILDSIKGITSKKKQSIIEGLKSNGDLETAISLFTTQGIGIRNIMKLEKIYGNNIMPVVYYNPYQLVEDVDGFGFTLADRLAKSIDFDMHSIFRTKAAAVSVIMDECFNRGDSYIYYDECEYLLTKRLGHHDFDYKQVIDDLEEAKLVYVEENRLYHHTQYLAEQEIAQFFADFLLSADLEINVEDLNNFIRLIEKEVHIEYDDIQKNAIKTFIQKQTVIVTGGPGTGKTTIVKAMIKLFKILYPHKTISICAPTGRAAKRLTELTGEEAMTIHRLLKWNLEENIFVFDESNPLPTNLLVIDEFSMVDPWLLHQLIKACGNVQKILLIGDEDQLPSVSCGATLRDFLATNLFPVVRLNHVYRQRQNSDMVLLAHKIKNNHPITFESTNDLRFYDVSPLEVKEFVSKLVLMAMEKGYETSDIQVLAPKYAGNNGIDALNNELQKVCNPPSLNKNELRVGYKIFREGDKVLQLKNQVEDDIYNGDIGIVKEICRKEYEEDNIDKIVVCFDDNIVVYQGEKIQNITHAYCISIHKSQGSEYPIVLMPILKEYSYMLTKKLIYTGITRAKKSLILLGTKDMFEKGIAKMDIERKTTLQERLLFFSKKNEFIK